MTSIRPASPSADPNRGPALITISAVLLFIAVISSILRLWVRLTSHALRWDDFTIVTAVVRTSQLSVSLNPYHPFHLHLHFESGFVNLTRVTAAERDTYGLLSPQSSLWLWATSVVLDSGTDSRSTQVGLYYPTLPLSHPLPHQNFHLPVCVANKKHQMAETIPLHSNDWLSRHQWWLCNYLTRQMPSLAR